MNFKFIQIILTFIYSFVSIDLVAILLSYIAYRSPYFPKYADNVSESLNHPDLQVAATPIVLRHSPSINLEAQSLPNLSHRRVISEVKPTC